MAPPLHRHREPKSPHEPSSRRSPPTRKDRFGLNCPLNAVSGHWTVELVEASWRVPYSPSSEDADRVLHHLGYPKLTAGRDGVRRRPASPNHLSKLSLDCPRPGTCPACSIPSRYYR